MDSKLRDVRMIQLVSELLPVFKRVFSSDMRPTNFLSNFRTAEWYAITQVRTGHTAISDCWKCSYSQNNVVCGNKYCPLPMLTCHGSIFSHSSLVSIFLRSLSFNDTIVTFHTDIMIEWDWDRNRQFFGKWYKYTDTGKSSPKTLKDKQNKRICLWKKIKTNTQILCPF